MKAIFGILLAVLAMFGFGSPTSAPATPAESAAANPVAQQVQSARVANSPSLRAVKCGTDSPFWVAVSSTTYPYFIARGSILYADGTPIRSVVLSADPSTLCVENGFASPVAKDQEHVYYAGRPISGVDAASLEPARGPLADPAYLQDATSVFSLVLPDGLYELVGADPRTFQALGATGFYASDATHVFWGWGPLLPGADPLTFEVLGENIYYARDNTHVWYRGELVSESNPATFSPLPLSQVRSDNCGQGCEFDAKDAKHRFRLGKLLSPTP